MTPVTPARLPVVPPTSAAAWLDARAAELDAALLGVARGISGGDPVLFAGDRLRFPKEKRIDDQKVDPAKAFAARCYGLLPTMRITDVLSQVDRWTGFTSHFGHVSTGLPPSDDRGFLAALIAEATNLGLSRMAEVCNVASRRALIRMQTWHMREETFRAALGCLTDAIHAEPLSAWFGEGWRASADGQAFYLGGPGEAGGTVNAHYGRDPIVKIYTTITDRYAPLHQTVIAGTAGEAIHALDGILGHESGVDLSALHVDGGGVSDIIFAVAHRLGLSFEPRIPRLSDRRLYAFEPRARYGKLAPLFGQRLDRELITAHWDDMARVTDALRDRVVTPSLILKKLVAYRQQNSLPPRCARSGASTAGCSPCAGSRTRRSARSSPPNSTRARPATRSRAPSRCTGSAVSATVVMRTSRPAPPRSTSSPPRSYCSTADTSIERWPRCARAA